MANGASDRGRRDFLKLATGAAASVACTGSGWSREPSRWIDVHYHVFPPEYLANAPAPMQGLLRSIPGVVDWTSARALRAMDHDGVQTAILSFPTPRAWAGGVSEQRRLARMCNEFFAGAVTENPSRFGLFAGLPPLTDVEGALEEIEHAYEVLHADGVRVMTVYGDMWLGHPAFEPVWSELDRRRSVVFVHPDTANCCVNIPSPASMELPLDTARAAADLWRAGVLARWRNIKFILSHGGGALPMIAGRLRDRLPLANETPTSGQEDPLVQFRRFYFDTANAATAPALAGLLALADHDNILFGSDAPFVRTSVQLNYLRAGGLPSGVLQGIEFANARRLMPGMRARALSPR